MDIQVIYSFEQYRLEPARRKLWCGDEEVAVQPKAFDCLAYLIENRDRVVGTDELIAAVWGRTDLTDNVVMHSIARARHAVGDSGEEQRAIRTVTRIGYAWNLSVDLVDTGNGNGQATHNNAAAEDVQDVVSGGVFHSSGTPVSVGAAAQRASSTASRPSGNRRRFSYGIAALLLIGLSVAAFFPRNPTSPLKPIDGETAIVLPVTVIGKSDSDAAWVRLGIMDLIAERLRELGQAVVPSDNTVALARTYLERDGNTPPAPEHIEVLARTAAAGLVLDVQAEAVGDHWRVSLRTVRGRDPAVVAQGDDQDLLVAARTAADRMAVLLGFALVPTVEPNPERQQIEHTLRQVRAATLSDRFDEAEKLLAGLDDARRSDPEVRLVLAETDTKRGRYEEAKARFADLIADLPAVGDELMRAKALHGLGYTFSTSGEYEQASTQYRKALALLEGDQDYEARVTTGKILMMLANGQKFRNDMVSAQANYARARMVFETVGDQHALARLDGNMADLFVRLSRNEAVSYGQRAVKGFGQFGDVQNELKARVMLAIAYYNLGDTPSALAEVLQLDDLLAKVNNPILSDTLLVTKFAILHEAGHLEAASKLLDELRVGRFDVNRIQHSVNLARGSYFSASQALEAGDYERAMREAKAALQAPWSSGLDVEHANAWLVLLGAQIELQEIEQATQTLADAAAWGKMASDDLGVGYVLALMHALHAAALGMHDRVASHFENALALADQSRRPTRIIKVVRHYSVWLIRQGDLEGATVVTGRVSAWARTNYAAALSQLRLYHAMGEATAWRLALERVRGLAGERKIPADLLVTPATRTELTVASDPR